MKRQRGKARPLYRYGRYRGRRSGEIRLTAAAVCAALGLVLVVIRGLGIRFSGFLLLGAAALLVLSWQLDRLATGNDRWRLVRRCFRGCVAGALRGWGVSGTPLPREVSCPRARPTFAARQK